MSNDVGKPLPEMRMRQGEMDGLFAMFAALQEFDGVKTDMRDRLKAIPNGYRDLRLAEATLSRLLARIVETIPAEKKRAIRRMLPSMKYKVYYNALVSHMDEDATAINAHDLVLLCQLVQGFYCFLCEEDCNHCKHGIAKVFDRVFKVDREKSWADFCFDEGEDHK